MQVPEHTTLSLPAKPTPPQAIACSGSSCMPSAAPPLYDLAGMNGVAQAPSQMCIEVGGCNERENVWTSIIGLAFFLGGGVCVSPIEGIDGVRALSIISVLSKLNAHASIQCMLMCPIPMSSCIQKRHGWGWAGARPFLPTRAQESRATATPRFKSTRTTQSPLSWTENAFNGT